MKISLLPKRIASKVGLDRSLAVNTGWMMVANMLRIGLQATYFVVVATTLGAEQYGAFVGVTALAGILKPFSGLGMGSILIKNVARDRSLLSIYWGNALVSTLGTGALLALFTLAIRRFILPDSISIWIVVLVGLSDLILAVVVETAAKAFQAVEMLDKTSLVDTSLFVARCLAALVALGALSDPDAVSWAILYCFSTFVAAAFAMVVVGRVLGWPTLELHRIRPEAVEGSLFALSQSGRRVTTNIDKVMLTNLSSLDATGVYGAAFRIVDVGMAPLRSLLAAAYARFFMAGGVGIGAGMDMAKRLLPISVLCGLAASVGLIVIAPFVPMILGDDYQSVVSILPWLAPLPLMRAIHLLASDVLSGAGFQRGRSMMIVVAALVNAGLNFVLIPGHSWLGAAWSSLVAEGFLVLGLWGLVLKFARTPN